jgi:hypothetical protein
MQLSFSLTARLYETSAAAYAANAKQSIVKFIRSVQSFLSVSSWRKSMDGEMPADRRAALHTDPAHSGWGVGALESLITKSIDRA